MFPLFNKLCLFLNFLWFDLFLFFLQIVLGFRLWHLHCILFGCCHCCCLLFFRSSSFICCCLHLDKRNIVPYHFFTHLLQFLCLLVDPLCLLYNYIVGSVVNFAVIPNQLNISQTTLYRLIRVVIQVASNCT